MKSVLLLFLTSLVLPLSLQALPLDERAQAEYQKGLAQWQEMERSRPRACHEAYESKQLLYGRKTAVSILILHGYSQNPERIEPYIDFLSKSGFNILAPRLMGHFDQNLKALDQISYQDWLSQAERSFQVAKAMGDRVVVIGYSLGGLLASRIALDHPEDISALILLSPAWRVNSKISGGSLIGRILNMSANDFLKEEVGCNSATPYMSSNGGRQVEMTASYTEHQFSGSYPSVESTVFRQINAPVLLAMIENDDTIDSRQILNSFSPHDSGYRTLLVYPGDDHGLLTKPQVAKHAFLEKQSRTPYESVHLLGQIDDFLRAQLEGLDLVLNYPKTFQVLPVENQPLPIIEPGIDAGSVNY
jgi:carboxylesterase